MITVSRYSLWFLIALTTRVVGQESNPHADKPYLIKSIFFGGGSYLIAPEHAGELYKFIDGVILENYEIHIHSHTDNIGGVEYNNWLSQMRSESVRRILIEKPIPENIIFIKDHGLFNPEFDNNSWSGRQKNRRVDVILWPKPA